MYHSDITAATLVDNGRNNVIFNARNKREYKYYDKHEENYLP